MATLFEAEVREQPATLARLISVGRERAEAIADRIRNAGVRFAVLAARGSSDNAARYGQYLLGIENSLVASLATPSLFTQYGAQPALGQALVIGISQSGESPDILAVVGEARRQGAVTVAFTNEPASPLASAAELTFPLLAGVEHAVAATKTYTAQLAAFAMLSAALRKDEQPWRELRALPDQVTRAIELAASLPAAAERYKQHSHMIVIGRGYNLATASEIALKITETAGVIADGYSSADFHHGPKAILELRAPMVAVAPGPRVFDDLDGVARLAQEKGAPLIVFSDREELLRGADVAVPLPTVPEWLSPVVAVVPGQLLALALSLSRGLQPDAPLGLSKVTRTR